CATPGLRRLFAYW
nr:immunoglobulin heavy chain junction region [Mus musculus]